MLDKKATLYERDEKGQLITKQVSMEIDGLDAETFPELVKETIKIVPMTRGEVKKLFGDTVKRAEGDNVSDADLEVVEKYCIEPKYTKEELPFIKPVIIRSIVSTVLRESGLSMGGKKVKKVDEDDEFGKN